MIALMPGFYAKKQHVLDVAEKKNHAHEAKKRAAALDAALGGHAGMVYAPEYDLNLVDTKKWAVVCSTGSGVGCTLHVNRVRRPATTAAGLGARAGAGAVKVKQQARTTVRSPVRSPGHAWPPVRRAQSAPVGTQRPPRSRFSGGHHCIGGGGGGSGGSAIVAHAPTPMVASVTMRARRSNAAARRRAARRLELQESLWESSTQSTLLEASSLGAPGSCWLVESSLLEAGGFAGTLQGGQGGDGPLAQGNAIRRRQGGGGGGSSSSSRLHYCVPPPPDPAHPPFHVPVPSARRSLPEQGALLERRVQNVAREARALRDALARSSMAQRLRQQLSASVSAAKQRELVLKERYAGAATAVGGNVATADESELIAAS